MRPSSLPRPSRPPSGLALPSAGAFYGTLELIGTGEPKIRAALTSLNAAAFDGSALVFMLLRVAARAARVGLAAPCLAWAALCAPLCVALWRLLPAHGPPLWQRSRTGPRHVRG